MKLPKLPDFRFQISDIGERKSDIRHPLSGIRPGFTLVEVIIAVAIIAILASATIVAINPAKRLAQARDAQRKSDINAIANALVGYFHNKDEYPRERSCDTSRGSYLTGGSANCATNVSGADWGKTGADFFYQGLVVSEGFLKNLPVDPINNLTYYYRYEGIYAVPGVRMDDCLIESSDPCNWFWVGARMEAVDDPTKQGKIVFRCTTMKTATLTPITPGCKEVELATSTDFDDEQYPE